MITVNKKIQISSGAGPYTYNWIANKSCVTFAPKTGTTSTGLVNTTVTGTDEACFDGLEVKLIATTSNNCSQTVVVDVLNPCNAFILSAINQLGYTFSVYPSGEAPSYTYSWVYDTDLFNSTGLITNDTFSTLSLQIKPNTNPPFSTQISVVTTDGSGCVKQQQLTVYICKPSASSEIRTAVYDSSAIASKRYSVSRLLLTATPCSASTPINWDTIQFTSVPSGFTTSRALTPESVTANPNMIYIWAAEGTPTGTYTVQYRVADSTGLYSNTGVISVQVNAVTVDVNSSSGLLAHNAGSKVPNSATVGTVLSIPLENYLSRTSDINWSSFTITEAPTVGSAYFDANNRYLTYIVGGLSNTIDKVNWRVNTTSGKQSNTAVWGIDLNITAAPIATNDSFCAVCGQSSGVRDITTNDTPGSPTSSVNRPGLLITQYPAGTSGTLAVNNDGFITFTPAQTQTSPVTFKYKVPNQDGVLSNEATVTVNVACAGKSPAGSVDITCYTSKALQLSSFVGSVSSNTVWSEITTGTTYLSQGGTITGGSIGNVDLTSTAPGIYTFKGTSIQSSCTATSQVSLIIRSVPYASNNQCGGAITLVYPTANGLNTTLQSQTNLGACPSILAPTESAVNHSAVSPEQNPTTWNITRSGDLWYTFTVPSASTVLDLTVTMTGIPHGTINGIKNPQVAIYRSAGSPCTIDDLQLLSSAAQASNSQSIAMGVSGLTPGATYWLRVSSGGTGNNGLFNLVLTGGLTA